MSQVEKLSKTGASRRNFVKLAAAAGFSSLFSGCDQITGFAEDAELAAQFKENVVRAAADQHAYLLNLCSTLDCDYATIGKTAVSGTKKTVDNAGKTTDGHRQSDLEYKLNLALEIGETLWNARDSARKSKLFIPASGTNAFVLMDPSFGMLPLPPLPGDLTIDCGKGFDGTLVLDPKFFNGPYEVEVDARDDHILLRWTKGGEQVGGALTLAHQGISGTGISRLEIAGQGKQAAVFAEQGSDDLKSKEGWLAAIHRFKDWGKQNQAATAEMISVFEAHREALAPPAAKPTPTATPGWSK